MAKKRKTARKARKKGITAPAAGVVIDTATAHFMADVLMEVGRARGLFPMPNKTLAALGEEVGELNKALLDMDVDKATSIDVFKEAVQVAAMACRVAIEGDPQFPRYGGVEGVARVQGEAL
jgi:hypothetical protein